MFEINDRPVVLTCGGGTNTFAVAIMWAEMKLPIDLVLFADTGGEKPHTYCAVSTLSDWLVKHGYPQVTIVKHRTKDGREQTLEEELVERGNLPSIVFGFKTCSQKYKIAPQDRFVNHWQPAKEAWARGEKVVKLVGYDADEEHRTARKFDTEKFDVIYPLVELGMGRKECIEKIKESDLPQPGKSACYFCPSSKPYEVGWLKENHPDLLERAIKMEKKGMKSVLSPDIKGLGRSFSWAEYVKQGDLFPDNFQDNYIDLACGCYDG